MSQRNRNRSRSRQNQRYRNRSRSPNRREQENLNYRQQKQLNGQQYNRRHQQKPNEETKVLCIEQITSNMLSHLQRKLTDTSIAIGTSVPDEVQIQQNIAIIKYPSVQVSCSIFNYLKGSISIGGKEWSLKFWPLKKSDINILYDWYCDKCEYKNFARRGKCHRCDNQRNQNCKLNYGSQFVSFNASTKKQQIQDAANCSLMIRGQIITEVEQELVLSLFQAFAPIKDIRMIRNKITGGNKDFAFVQFFTPEQAAFALRQTNSSDFRVCGERVTVMYSRTKQDDQFYARPYDKDRRGPPPPRRQSKQSEDTPNYYLRQRQLEIEEQKKRPLITLEKLKQKRQIEMKKILPQQKELSEQQNQRRKAQMLAKQWQKQMKTQSATIYVCPLCKRKFKNQDQMNNHSKYSEVHKYRLARMDKQAVGY